MLESVRAGAPVELPEEPTLASALSGGIGELLQDFSAHAVASAPAATRSTSTVPPRGAWLGAP